jgi:hypothetical protein
MGRRLEVISEDWLAVLIGLAVFALSLDAVAGLTRRAPNSNVR